jgi:hypothetical protein
MRQKCGRVAAPGLEIAEPELQSHNANIVAIMVIVT